MGGKWPFGTLVPSPHYGNMGCQVSKTKKDKKLDRFLKKKIYIFKRNCVLYKDRKCYKNRNYQR